MSRRIGESFSEFIIKEQHGFMKGRSTLSNLILYIYFISSILYEYGRVDSLILDFQKAFDSVDHGLLIYKLRHIGMSSVS